MRPLVAWSLVSMVFGVAVIAAPWRAEAAEPKYTIKEVMKKGHTPPKSSLAAKVIKKEASAEEKKMLLEMYESMAASKPPKGDDESWKKLTSALVEATKEIVEGKAGGEDKLNEAVNCGMCHKAHKA